MEFIRISQAHVADSVSIMARKKKNLTNIKRLKAGALKQRMKDLNLGELELAQRCFLTKRDAVSKWRAGISWPHAPGEATLEQALSVPSGFFRHIAEGMPYDDALAASAVSLQKPSSADILRSIAGRLNSILEEIKGSLNLADLGIEGPFQSATSDPPTAPTDRLSEGEGNEQDKRH